MITAAPESVGLVPERLIKAMAVLDDAVADSRIGGAVFGMVREGKLAFLQAVGYRDTAKTERMRPDAIFPLASMTKPIASVAAMILVERARMLLTDPIERFLPAFRDAKVLTTYGLEPTRLPITLLDLLRHTAGIGSATVYPDSPVGKLYAQAGVHDPEQPLAACIDKLAAVPLMHQPGTIWDYSISTDVLARVVEVVSGTSFQHYVAEQVTKPLQMVDTSFVAPEAEWDRLTEPCIDQLTSELPPRQDGRLLPARIGGNSGLVGTASDYLRFCQMILDGGTLEGTRLLGAGTVAHMSRDHLGAIPHNTPTGNWLLGPGRGFGLGFAVDLGGNAHPHPGSSGSFFWGGAFGTQFVIDPKHRMAAVMMINQRNQFDWCLNVFRPLLYAALA
jgi:CubicO group peptidase (beta-lactamase class C family)